MLAKKKIEIKLIEILCSLLLKFFNNNKNNNKIVIYIWLLGPKSVIVAASTALQVCVWIWLNYIEIDRKEKKKKLSLLFIFLDFIFIQFFKEKEFFLLSIENKNQLTCMNYKNKKEKTKNIDNIVWIFFFSHFNLDRYILLEFISNSIHSILERIPLYIGI